MLIDWTHILALALPLATVEAAVFNASFTWYGEGDEQGSQNCNSVTPACGIFTFVSLRLPTQSLSIAICIPSFEFAMELHYRACTRTIIARRRPIRH